MSNLLKIFLATRADTFDVWSPQEPNRLDRLREAFFLDLPPPLRARVKGSCFNESGTMFAACCDVPEHVRSYRIVVWGCVDGRRVADFEVMIEENVRHVPTPFMSPGGDVVALYFPHTRLYFWRTTDGSSLGSILRSSLTGQLYAMFSRH